MSTQNRKKRQSKKTCIPEISKTHFDVHHLNKLHYEIDDLSNYDFITPVCLTKYNSDRQPIISEFILPYKAFTLNAYYRSNRKIVHISKEGLEWKTLIHNFITTHNLPKIYGGVRAEFGFFFRTKQKRDLDNLFKPLIDVFKNILFEDDDMIFEIDAYKKIGMGNDLIHVKLQHMTTSKLN